MRRQTSSSRTIANMDLCSLVYSISRLVRAASIAPKTVSSFIWPALSSLTRSSKLLRVTTVLIVNSIPLAQSRESGDAPSHGGYAKTYLVGGHRALQITRLS